MTPKSTVASASCVNTVMMMDESEERVYKSSKEDVGGIDR
jgi:hypothetical protein